MAENDLKSDIAAAFDKAEEEPAPAPAPEPAPEVVADATIGEPPADGRERDDKGRFKPKVGEPAAEKKEPPKQLEIPEPKTVKVPSIATGKDMEVEVGTPPPPAPEKPKYRPPASWKPTAREGWDKLPPDIQAEVIRREKDISTALNESAEARDTYKRFRDTVSPYEAMIRSQGAEPIQVVGNLLRTAAQLATAPGPARAQVVADIIKTYGVDIPTLDALLSGQPAPQGQPQQWQPPDPSQFRDPRLDALLAQQQAMLQQKAAAQIEEVEQEEFFEDVREDMADLLDVASKRGVALSARDAYNRAVLLHPEVSRVMEQRRAAATQGGATQRAMAASSSVRAQPASGVEAPKDLDLRGALEAAFDKAGNR